MADPEGLCILYRLSCEYEHVSWCIILQDRLCKIGLYIPITDLYYLAIVSYKIEFVYPTTIIHIEL